MAFLPRGNLILENDSNQKLCHTTFMVYEDKSSCIHIPIETSRIKYRGCKHLHIDILNHHKNIGGLFLLWAPLICVINPPCDHHKKWNFTKKFTTGSSVFVLESKMDMFATLVLGDSCCWKVSKEIRVPAICIFSKVAVRLGSVFNLYNIFTIVNRSTYTLVLGPRRTYIRLHSTSTIAPILIKKSKPNKMS